MGEARPFDTLNSSIDGTVLIKLKEGQEVKGVLKTFDVHMNIVLEDAEEISGDKKKKYGTLIVRGDNILFISPSREE